MMADYFVDVDLDSASAADPPPPPASPATQRRAAALQAAVADVVECRSKLAALGEPPDHDAVEEARRAIAALDAALSAKLERLYLAPPPQGLDAQTQKEEDLREFVQVAKMPHEAVLQADELYRSYERLLKDAEEKMERLSSPDMEEFPLSEKKREIDESEASNQEISSLLPSPADSEISLKGRGISRLPDSFFSTTSIVSLDLSSNCLEALSDSIGNLVSLESCNVEKNQLISLPDSIGLLKSLKVLNVSANKLTALPESILLCSSLVSLRADMNELSYLPSQLGFNLINLQELSVQWNKLRSLPASVCNLKSLKYLNVRFNHLRELPSAIGNLNSLEVLDASCNFMDLKTVPDTIGDLTDLIELNLSCNQIRILPDSFGRLQALERLDLRDNPLVIPPVEVVVNGVQAVLAYMKERWKNFLEEQQQQQRSLEEKQQQTKWLPWTAAGSWLTRALSGSFDGGVGSRWQRHRSEDYLEQQL